jgi:hypothetical protein
MAITARPADATHELVERIVRRLLAGGAAAMAEPLPIPPGARAPGANMAAIIGPVAVERPTAPSLAPATAPSIAPVGELAIPSRVITAAELPSDLSAIRTVLVLDGAVLTPSARERLTAAGITIGTRSAPSAKAARSSSKSLAATAPAPTTESSPSEMINGLMVASDLGTAEEGPGPAIVAQLQRRGLTTQLTSVDDLLKRLPRGGRGLLLTQHPQKVVCDACRSPEIRAAQVASMSEVADVHRDLKPNLWVIDMRRLSLSAAVPIAAICLRTSG